jgi:radical SAM protein with 4Fe4S-binding SPASM domain
MRRDISTPGVRAAGAGQRGMTMLRALAGRLPRRQYLRVAGRALREGRVGWTVRQGVKSLVLPLSRTLDRPLTGPIIANLAITYRCNNVCYQCDLPRPWYYRKRGESELSTAEFERIIDELAELGVAGVSITGGEPSLRRDHLTLLAHVKRAGLNANLNTNAFTLVEPQRVAALLATGVDSINISLDGACAATHDRLRGAPGGFDRVARATELLLAARQNGRPSITYIFVIGTDNHTELMDFIELARARGIDSVGFMPVFDVYRDRQERSPEARLAMEASVARLRARKRGADQSFIDNTDAYLSLFGAAWRGEPSPLRCYATYHNLLIGSYGNVFPCALPFSNGDAPIGNVRSSRVADFWRSDTYQARRRELDGCRACYWNCHTEANLLYQRVPSV